MAAWFIPGFAGRQPKARKGQPWVRLYREDSSRFASLPLLTRGVAFSVLRLCDTEGRIDCGTTDPLTILARLLRVTGEERKAMTRHVERLLAHGFVVLEGAKIGAAPGIRKGQHWGTLKGSTRAATGVAQGQQVGTLKGSDGDPAIQKSLELFNTENTDQRRIEEREEISYRGRKDRAPSEHQIAKTAWFEGWSRLTGNPHPGWGAREGAILKRLLDKPGGLSDLLARMSVLLNDPPAWIAKGGGSPGLGTLERCWDGLAVPGSAKSQARGPGDVADRMAEKAIATMKAERREGEGLHDDRGIEGDSFSPTEIIQGKPLAR